MPKPKADAVEYEIVTNASQIAAPPPLRREWIGIPELKKSNGKSCAFWAHELSAGEHGAYEISDRVFNEVGEIIRFKRTGHQMRFLAAVLRDGGGNRVYSTFEKAEEEMQHWGKSIINKLMIVAQRVNYDDHTSADEAAASAEGNSEETKTS